MLPVLYSIASAFKSALAVMATRRLSYIPVIQSFVWSVSDAASLFFIRLTCDISGSPKKPNASVTTISMAVQQVKMLL